MKTHFVLAVLLLVLLALIPSHAVADSEFNFHDAITKYYNDNGHPKQLPTSPLVLQTTFSVDKDLDVYLMLEDSQDNRPISDPANFKMRIILRNSTWSYTDLGQFGDGAPLTAPTNPLTVSPGFNYTVEMQITFTESIVNINDTFEFSAIIGIETGGGYSPTDSISHIVRFKENPPPLPPITAKAEPPPFMLIASLIAVGVVVAYFTTKRRLKKKDEGDEDET